ncbi:MAG: hypothetical protein ACP5RE_03435 [Candidatus Acidifodinimicrobium sp.]
MGNVLPHETAGTMNVASPVGLAPSALSKCTVLVGVSKKGKL